MKQFYLSDGMDLAILESQQVAMKIFEELVKYDELEYNIRNQAILEGTNYLDKIDYLNEDMKDKLQTATKAVINWSKQKIIDLFKMLQHFTLVIINKINNLLHRGLNYNITIEWFVDYDKSTKILFEISQYLSRILLNSKDIIEKKVSGSVIKTFAGKMQTGLMTRQIRMIDYPDEINNIETNMAYGTNEIKKSLDDLIKHSNNIDNNINYTELGEKDGLVLLRKLINLYKIYHQKYYRILYNAIAKMANSKIAESYNQNINPQDIERFDETLMTEYNIFRFDNLWDSLYIDSKPILI